MCCSHYRLAVVGFNSKYERPLLLPQPRVQCLKALPTFFIADSVVRGDLMMANLSMRTRRGWDLRGYLGVRASDSVLGRWKVHVDLNLRVARLWVPLRTAFLAAVA